MSLAALALLLLPQTGPADWAVVPYGTDLAARDRWIVGGHAVEDLGGWLVTRGVERLPDAAIPLDSLRDGEELVMVAAHQHPGEAQAPLPAGRVLWTAPDRSVVLVAADRSALGQAPLFRCHGALRALSGGTALRPATFTTPPGGSMLAALQPDPDIQTWVGQVAQANLQADVASLEGFGTRRHGQPGEFQAEAWLVSRLQSYGLSVSTFDYDSGADVVVGELTGLADPSKVVIVGGHYDSINYAGTTAAAPGADDDASGTAGVLEIARILSQHDFDFTIRFCAWSGEEMGLLGSAAYAAALRAAGVDVIGMVQLDMTAYRAPGDTLSVDFVLNDTDPGLNQFAIDAFAAYVPGLQVNQGFLSGGTSDHRSFFQNGYPATFPFEDLGSYSPYIHGYNDVTGVSANDFQLAGLITQGALATVAELARPASLLLTHQPLGDTLDEQGPYPVVLNAQPLSFSAVAGATLHWRVDGGPWQAQAMSPGTLPGDWLGAIPGQVSPTMVDYWLEAVDGVGHDAWLPSALAPGAATYDFVVGIRSTVHFEDFEGPGDAGWTHAQVATQDDWQRGAPQGKAGDPATAYSGASCWGNDLGGAGYNGEYQPNVSNWLQSPPIDCSGRGGVRLRFARWLTVEESQYDQARILVNGQEVWRNPYSGNLIDTGWSLQELDIAQWADNQPAVVVRFELQSDGGLQFGGWNLDDFELYVLAPSNGSSDLLTLTGPANGAVGQTLAFTVSGMQAGEHWWLAGGTQLGGSTVLGHGFDLGAPYQLVGGGTANAAGSASALVTVPAAASGRTVYLEAAAMLSGYLVDSNPLTLVIQ